MYSQLEIKTVKQNFTAKEKLGYISGIDGLRAIAVVAVMLFHLDPSFLPGGFTGVDVFFVISGYVVSSSLARDRSSSFHEFLLSSYARRIIRIFPALFVCLIIVSVMSTLFIPAIWQSNANEKTALFAFFGVSNFALIWYNDGYFAPNIQFNPFSHTWSLGVEEQFYLIFPLIFFIWLRYKEKPGYLGICVNWLLVSLIFVSLFYSWYETAEHPNEAFFLLLSRFWELACGALLFQLHSRQKLISDSEIKSKLYLTVGMTLIGLGFVFSDKMSFPFPWALLPVCGSIFLIIGIVNNFNRKPIIQRLLENQIVVYVGKISYSLYLWHWPVYVFFRWTIGLDTLLQITAVPLTFFSKQRWLAIIFTPINRWIAS